jgi:hypothetical protein
MNRPSLRLTRTWALIAWVALFAVSCAKKPVSLTDPSLSPPTYPEGRAGNTHLVMYPDTPVPLQIWQDNGLAGESPDDVLLATTFVYESGPGAVVGMIIDSTNASQYEVYKRHSDGGYVDLLPNTLKPVKTWPASHFDSYLFSDPNPFSPPLREYVGRGVVDGQVTTDAPLTNVSDLTQLNEAGALQYLSPESPAGTDSLIPFHWQAVPGAAGYWVTMYAFPPAYLGQNQLFRNALPHPVLPDKLPEYFIGYFPGNVTAYRIGDPLPPGASLLSWSRAIVTNNDYAVRITAVDANGQMLDYTGSTGAFLILGVAQGIYYRLPLNAVLVHPLPVPPPPGAETSAHLAVPGRALAPGEARISLIRGPRH